MQDFREPQKVSMIDIVFASIARILVIGSQLAYVKLYANHLSNYELGIYFFLTTASYSLNAFLFVPIDYFQQSKLYFFVRNNISLMTLVNFSKTCISWTFPLMLLIVAGLVFIRVEFAIYALLAWVFSIVVYVGTSLKGALNNLEHRGLVSAVMAAEAVFKVLVFYLFVTFLPGCAMTLLASAIIALVLALVPLVFTASRLAAFTSGRVDVVRPREVFRFAYPITIGAVVNWIQLQGYRMVLVPLGFAETVGIYATVSNVGHAGMGANAIVYGQIFLPRIYKTSGEYTNTYLRNALFLVGFICAFSILFSDFLVVVVSKEEFRQYSRVIVYGVIAEACNFIIGALSVHITLTSDTRRTLPATMLALVSVVIAFGGLYLLQAINVYTVGLPVVVSQIVVTIYLYLLYVRIPRSAKSRGGIAGR